MDIANNVYSSSFQESYAYSQAVVSIEYGNMGSIFAGTLSAQSLMPNFAYQMKLVGTLGTDENELIGLAGRWWEQE